jgi:alpha-L-arabinofuranosidase
VARMEIRADRPVGTVYERIFGGFIEYLGRCIYGGVFDEGSPRADTRGFRTDVLGAVRDLSLRHVRWPGGNFVSGLGDPGRIPAGGTGPPARQPAWALSRTSGLVVPDEYRGVHGQVWADTVGG